MSDHDAPTPPPPPPGRPTIRDVARAANVSIGTASKALNHRGQLRPATRARVLAEAARLEFRPNDLVRSLLRGRSFTVGVMTTDYVGRFSGPVAAGIEDALAEADILVFTCTIQDDPERERRAIDGLLAKQVDGIIVTGRRIDARPPISLGRAQTPVVYAYATTDDPASLCIVPDEVQAGAMAAAHLIGLGRRHLAYIGGPDRFIATHLRLSGVRDAVTAAGLALPERHVRRGPWSERWGAEAVTSLLAAAAPIDAVICASDQIARGAATALAQRGVRVPADIAIVGFDNWAAMAEAAAPPLTTIDLGLDRIGREAGRHLLAMIDGERLSGTIRTPCTLVIRESCGAEGRSATDGHTTDAGDGSLGAGVGAVSGATP